MRMKTFGAPVSVFASFTDTQTLSASLADSAISSVQTDPAVSPVADGALWCADERAELLEGEQSGVVPVGWDLDGVHGLWHDLFLSMSAFIRKGHSQGPFVATFA